MFLAQLEADIMTVDNVKANLAVSKIKMYESEVPKFLEKFPSYSEETLVAQLKAVDVFKAVGSKKSPGEPRQSLLNTVGKAVECGVEEANIQEYLSLITEIKEKIHRLNEITPQATVSFALPKKKAKEKVAA